jgi:membrane protein|tara:strand:- start:9649 stop:10599 length:951 start_codon:yes stop_codon:yes gene_type:complete
VLNLVERIQATRLYKKWRILSERIKPIGFEGLTLYAVGNFFLDGLKQGALTTRGAAIAFRLFLAFFPAILVMLSLIPLVPIVDFQDNLFAAIEQVLPGDTFALFEQTIADLILNKHNEVLSASFLVGLFFASNSINAILSGFNGSVNLEKKGGLLKTRLFSLGVLFVMALVVVVCMALVTLSEVIFDYGFARVEMNEGIAQFLVSSVRYIIIITLIYSVVTLLYNVGNLDMKKFKFFSAGAMLTTIFFLMTTIGFAIYLNNFGNYNELYGTLGTLVVLLVWLDFNCLILLLGFELNASISKATLLSDIKLEPKMGA